MQLIVFDIDDTLTQSMAADTDCFVRSLDQVFGLRNVSTDWSSYEHVSDEGILAELFERHKGRGLTATEKARFKSHFLEQIRATIERIPIEPVAGASNILDSLQSSPLHDTALATGAWRDSATLKLSSAGIDVTDIPLASSDDHFARAEILGCSIKSARQQNPCNQYSSIIYVGDGVWDAITCRAINLPFLGIATGPKANTLIELGAHRVFPDFTDHSRFFETLNELDRPHN